MLVRLPLHPGRRRRRAAPCSPAPWCRTSSSPGEAARRKRSYIAVILGVVSRFSHRPWHLAQPAAGSRSVHVILISPACSCSPVSAFALGNAVRSGTWTRRATQPARGGPAPRPGHHQRLQLRQPVAYVAGAPVVTMREMGLSFGCTRPVRLRRHRVERRGVGERRLEAISRLGALQVVWPALRRPGRRPPSCSASPGRTWAATPASSDPAAVPHAADLFFARGMAAPDLVRPRHGMPQKTTRTASATLGVVQLMSGAAGGYAVVAAPSCPYVGAPPRFTVPMALLAGTAALLWPGLALLPGRLKQLVTSRASPHVQCRQVRNRPRQQARTRPASPV